MWTLDLLVVSHRVLLLTVYPLSVNVCGFHVNRLTPEVTTPVFPVALLV